MFFSAMLIFPTVARSAEDAKDQGKHNRQDDRRHDREIDADISVRALILDIAWQKRKSGRDVGPVGSRASVCEPTDEGKSQHHDNEDFEKGIHDAIGDQSDPAHTFQWTLVHLDAGSLPHHVAWNVGCWQFLFTNGLDFAAADLDESSGATTDSASWLGNAAGDQFAATLLILSPFWSQPCRLEGIAA
jgi:hypothetical protein